MSEERKVFRVSDQLIGQIAKLVQLSILTGTNVVDHMRLMRVEGKGEEVTLTPEYAEYFENSIQSMLSEVEALQEEMRNTVVEA